MARLFTLPGVGRSLAADLSDRREIIERTEEIQARLRDFACLMLRFNARFGNGEK